MDSAHIGIGRQTAVHLTLNQPKDKYFELNVEKDTTGKVEVVKLKQADTTDLGGMLEIKQDVIITSFDSGSCIIPPFKYVDIRSGETVSCNALALEVNNDIEIKLDEAGQPDSTSVNDIKEIMSIGFDWGKFFTILLIILLSAVLGFLGWKYLWPIIKKKLDKRKAEKEGLEIPEETAVVLPLEVIANQKLDAIKSKRIWQDESRIKEYYSDLTDTLREYFCGRFGINAMEMTSDEILDELKYNPKAMPMIEQLKDVLRKADMAKFAKTFPTESDCESSLANSYYIVSSTTPTSSAIEGEQKS